MTRSCLANIEYGAGLAAALRQRAVIVRHFAAPRISDYLRITVGRCCNAGRGGLRGQAPITIVCLVCRAAGYVQHGPYMGV